MFTTFMALLLAGVMTEVAARHHKYIYLTSRVVTEVVDSRQLSPASSFMNLTTIFSLLTFIVGMCSFMILRFLRRLRPQFLFGGSSSLSTKQPRGWSWASLRRYWKGRVGRGLQLQGAELLPTSSSASTLNLARPLHQQGVAPARKLSRSSSLDTLPEMVPMASAPEPIYVFSDTPCLTSLTASSSPFTPSPQSPPLKHTQSSMHKFNFPLPFSVFSLDSPQQYPRMPVVQSQCRNRTSVHILSPTQYTTDAKPHRRSHSLGGVPVRRLSPSKGGRHTSHEIPHDERSIGTTTWPSVSPTLHEAPLIDLSPSSSASSEERVAEPLTSSRSSDLGILPEMGRRRNPVLLAPVPLIDLEADDPFRDPVPSSDDHLQQHPFHTGHFPSVLSSEPVKYESESGNALSPAVSPFEDLNHLPRPVVLPASDSASLSVTSVEASTLQPWRLKQGMKGDKEPLIHTGGDKRAVDPMVPGSQDGELSSGSTLVATMFLGDGADLLGIENDVVELEMQSHSVARDDPTAVDEVMPSVDGEGYAKPFRKRDLFTPPHKTLPEADPKQDLVEEISVENLKEMIPGLTPIGKDVGDSVSEKSHFASAPFVLEMIPFGTHDSLLEEQPIDQEMPAMSHVRIPEVQTVSNEEQDLVELEPLRPAQPSQTLNNKSLNETPARLEKLVDFVDVPRTLHGACIVSETASVKQECDGMTGGSPTFCCEDLVELGDKQMGADVTVVVEESPAVQILVEQIREPSVTSFIADMDMKTRELPAIVGDEHADFKTVEDVLFDVVDDDNAQSYKDTPESASLGHLVDQPPPHVDEDFPLAMVPQVSSSPVSLDEKITESLSDGSEQVLNNVPEVMDHVDLSGSDYLADEHKSTGALVCLQNVEQPISPLHADEQLQTSTIRNTLHVLPPLTIPLITVSDSSLDRDAHEALELDAITDPELMPLPVFEPREEEEKKALADVPSQTPTPSASPPPSPTSPLLRSSRRPAWSVRASDAPALGLASVAGFSPTVPSTPLKGDEQKDDAAVVPPTPVMALAVSLPGAFPESPSTDVVPLISSAAFTDSASAAMAVTSMGSRPSEIRRRTMRSPLDIALAMQLRPGLGLGADPAWMVRFLMTMFGWFALLLSGQVNL